MRCQTDHLDRQSIYDTMPLDVLQSLWCDRTSDLAKLLVRHAVYDSQLGGVDGRRLGMGDYLLKIASAPTSGNAARFSALRTQLLEARM